MLTAEEAATNVEPLIPAVDAAAASLKAQVERAKTGGQTSPNAIAQAALTLAESAIKLAVVATKESAD